VRARSASTSPTPSTKVRRPDTSAKVNLE
jgi:hypothetical protein